MKILQLLDARALLVERHARELAALDATIGICEGLGEIHPAPNVQILGPQIALEKLIDRPKYDNRWPANPAKEVGHRKNYTGTGKASMELWRRMKQLESVGKLPALMEEILFGDPRNHEAQKALIYFQRRKGNIEGTLVEGCKQKCRYSLAGMWKVLPVEGEKAQESATVPDAGAKAEPVAVEKPRSKMPVSPSGGKRSELARMAESLFGVGESLTVPECEARFKERFPYELKHRRNEDLPCTLLDLSGKAVLARQRRESDGKVVYSRGVFWKGEIAQPLPAISVPRDEKTEQEGNL